ncbi:hypothetical protein UlMin_031248 [Ulmus minor]
MIKISRGSLVIMKGLKQNGLYVLQGSTITGEAAAAIPNIQDKTDLWHKRLGHISEKGLEVLKKQGAFGKDTISKVTFCEHCVLGKHHRLSFKTGVHKTNGTLEYIHADLWGPAKTQTQGALVRRLWPPQTLKGHRWSVGARKFGKHRRSLEPSRKT